MRPVVRYFGGKWMLAPWVVSHFPPHRVYTECFGGAASVLMLKARSYAEVYNDMDGEIVNVFRVLRNASQARELERMLRLTPFAREEFETSYLASGDPVEQARRTIARAFMGYGSDAHAQATGFRANSNRSGTTPAHDWANYPEQIERFAERLRGVAIENRPALEVMRQHDAPETLHYVDPPYPRSTRGKQARYRFEMTDSEHAEMAAALRSLSGMVIVSGYLCELYSSLYGDWGCVTKGAYADGARPRTEALWLSPSVKQAQPSLFEVSA